MLLRLPRIGIRLLAPLRVRLQHGNARVSTAPRPRAAARSPPSARRSFEARLAAGVAASAALLAAPFLYLYATGGLTLSSFFERVSDAWAGLAQVGGAELVLLLPAWDSYAEGERGGGAFSFAPLGAEGAAAAMAAQPAVGRAGASLPRPRFTVVLGWEGVCVDVAYDPKAGFKPLARPGLASLLLALAAAGAEVVVWSSASPSAVVAEQLAGVVAGAVAPLDVAGYLGLQARMEEAYERARAHEAAAAALERRAPRPMLPITREDRVAQYASHALRIAAVLGSEHTVPGEGGGGDSAAPANVRPVAALTHERAPWDVVVVDAAPRGAAGLPPTPALRGAQHVAVPPWAARAAPGEDPTLFLLAELFLWFGGWRRAAERRAPPPGAAAHFSGARGPEGVPATDPEASVAAFFEHAVGGPDAFRAHLEEGGGLGRALVEGAREQLRQRLQEEERAAGGAAAPTAQNRN
jgi:hypothetical protein